MVYGVCHMRLYGAGVTMLPGTAGWVTAMDMDCLSMTIEYALQIELDNGNVQAAYQKWLAPASCGLTARRGMPQGNDVGDNGWRRKGGGGIPAAPLLYCCRCYNPTQTLPQPQSLPWSLP